VQTVATETGIRTRRWRIAHWRALALIGVNLLIAAHLLHWTVAGETLGRVVLADAKITLERGMINPGFLLFALALASTALFGRFFCGWACHMGGLQDLSAWLLARAGIRPRPFRSRLLGWIPLLLALYLFVWPSLVRSLIAPWLSGVTPEFAAWLDPPAPLRGWSLALRSRDLWVGMPDLAVAIPFLLVCGVATVYFLGARGLCRYGCPYGGLLRPVEQLAPLRIVVDPDRCDGCARCSAACTLSIRVHEQVQAHGAVLDADCMRTLDCVDACPHQALALRPTTPPAWREQTPPPTYDLRLRDELRVAAVAFMTLLATRGLYGRIPLLLAATLAVLAGFLVFLGLKLAERPDWRFARLNLRRAGRLTRAGLAAAVLLLVLASLLAQTLVLRAVLWQAARLDAQVLVGFATVAADAVPPPQRTAAARAARWYRLAQPLGDGGIALAVTPEVPLRLAWLDLVQGECATATARLATEQVRRPTDAVVATARKQAEALCALSPRSRP